MKKRIAIVLVTVIIMAVTLVSLSGCATKLDHDEAFQIMKDAYTRSIDYDIFYSKEVKLNGDNVPELTRVNSVCDLDKKNNYAKAEDGSYINHNIHIYNEIDSQMQLEIFVGLSKDGKSDPGQNLAFKSIYTGKGTDDKAKYDKTRTPMTVPQFQNEEYYQQFKLVSKYDEINRLTRSDVVFSEKEGATKSFDLINLKFSVTEEYTNRYFEETGRVSTLKGKYIDMEITFERIARIVVMQSDPGTASIFGEAEFESYKIEVVYLGPRISVPKYNEKNSDKTPVWREVPSFN